jgi:asparagine synthase (glutamine-hydrolysing)
MRNQRATNWASMAHSMELRVPLVDAQGKRMLPQSPHRPLPAKVVERGKTGFTTPIQTWLERDKRIAWARRWAFQVAAA